MSQALWKAAVRIGLFSGLCVATACSDPKLVAAPEQEKAKVVAKTTEPKKPAAKPPAKKPAPKPAKPKPTVVVDTTDDEQKPPVTIVDETPVPTPVNDEDGVLADCEADPSFPQCAYHDGRLVVDCSVNPDHSICQAFEGGISETCDLAGAIDAEDDLAPDDCVGGKRAFGVLIAEKNTQEEVGEREKVDILWVYDNSPSMKVRHEKIAQNFNYFAQRLQDSDIDFHFAIVLTDPTPGQIGKFVSPVFTSDTPNFVQAFSNTVTGLIRDRTCSPSDPESSCMIEQGINTAEAALKKASAGEASNAGFLRADAKLSVIFTSDSDDMTDTDDNGVTASGDPTTDRGFLAAGSGSGHRRREDFDDILSRKSGGLKQVVMSSVVADGSLGCSRPSWYYNSQTGFWHTKSTDDGTHDFIESIGERYMALSRETGGYIASICETDLVPILDALGASTVGLKTNFPLSSKNVDVRSIIVKVNDVIVPRNKKAGWSFDKSGNAVIFNGTGIPIKGATVLISYYELKE